MHESDSPRLRFLRRLLLVVSVLGGLLFAGVVALSFIEPLWIERAAREVLRHEVEKRVGERIDQLSNARVVQLAQKALGRTDAEIAARQKALRDEIPQRVANAIADLMKADCECRKRMVEGAVKHQEGVLGTLEQAREQLARRIESAYGEVSRQLLRELRIFAGVNALAFVLLGAITLKGRASVPQLLLPAVAVIGAATVTAAIYLFSQNWLHTIVFGDYVGWAYLAWYGLALAWLADLLCNRGRVTAHLVNAASAVATAPC
jgi:hypothetical protein